MAVVRLERWGKHRIDPALDHPTGVERDLRVAQSNTQLILATKNYFQSIRDRTDEGVRLLRDLKVGRLHGQRLIVLLEIGQVPPDGLFAADARIILTDYVAGLAEAAKAVQEELDRFE